MDERQCVSIARQRLYNWTAAMKADSPYAKSEGMVKIRFSLMHMSSKPIRWQIVLSKSSHDGWQDRLTLLPALDDLTFTDWRNDTLHELACHRES